GNGGRRVRGGMEGGADRTENLYNNHEPLDSAAAGMAAQGLLRLGRVLSSRGDADAARYEQGGLRVLDTLLGEPYLSTSERHQGLLLHSGYHWPNRWDHVPAGSEIPRGGSSPWGGHHPRG